MTAGLIAPRVATRARATLTGVARRRCGAGIASRGNAVGGNADDNTLEACLAWRPDDPTLDRAALAARQHHPRGRHGLGPAALASICPRPCGPEANADFAAHPPAHQEIRRRLARLRGGGAPPRGQGARRREGRRAGDRARELLHGGASTGARRSGRSTRTTSRICSTTSASASATRTTRSSPIITSRRRGSRFPAASAARLVSPAAGLQRRAHPGGGVDPRHGQLQGDGRRAVRRPLALARHRGARARRAGPVREPGARHLRQHGGLDRPPARRCVDWLAARPEIDPDRIGITGNSFGSFFATIAAAHEPRFRAWR